MCQTGEVNEDECKQRIANLLVEVTSTERALSERSDHTHSSRTTPSPVPLISPKTPEQLVPGSEKSKFSKVTCDPPIAATRDVSQIPSTSFAPKRGATDDEVSLSYEEQGLPCHMTPTPSTSFALKRRATDEVSLRYEEHIVYCHSLGCQFEFSVDVTDDDRRFHYTKHEESIMCERCLELQNSYEQLRNHTCEGRQS